MSQSLPTIGTGRAMQGTSLGINMKRGAVGRGKDEEHFPTKEERMEEFRSHYDMVEPGASREKLSAKVLSSTKSTSPHSSKPRHRAVEEVADWMRAERKRAEERAERRWRRRFEEWQRESLVPKASAAASKRMSVESLASQDMWDHRSSVGIGGSTPPRSNTPSRTTSRHASKGRVSALPELPGASGSKRSVSSGSISGRLEHDMNAERVARMQEQIDQMAQDIQDSQQQAQAANAALASAQGEIARLKEQLEATEHQRDKYHKDLGRHHKEIMRLSEDYRQEREQRAIVERHLVDLGVERDSWRVNAERREERLKQALQEKRDISARLVDVGRFLHDLEERSIVPGQVDYLTVPDRRPSSREMQEAAVKLQRVARGRQSRNRVQTLKLNKEQKTAAKLKLHSDKEAWEERRRREAAAATRIQSRYRGGRARIAAVDRRKQYSKRLEERRIKESGIKETQRPLPQLSGHGVLRQRREEEEQDEPQRDSEDDGKRVRRKASDALLGAADDGSLRAMLAAEMQVDSDGKEDEADKTANKQPVQRSSSSPALASGSRSHELSLADDAEAVQAPPQQPATTRAGDGSKSLLPEEEEEDGEAATVSPTRGRSDERAEASDREPPPQVKDDGQQMSTLRRSQSWAERSKANKRTRSRLDLEDDKPEMEAPEKDLKEEEEADKTDTTAAVQAQARAALIKATRNGSIGQVIAEHLDAESRPTEKQAAEAKEEKEEKAEEEQDKARPDVSFDEPVNSDEEPALEKVARKERRVQTGFVKLGELPPEEDEEDDEEDESRKVGFEEDEGDLEEKPVVRKERRIQTGFVKLGELPPEEEEEDDEHEETSGDGKASPSNETRRRVSFKDEDEEAAPQAKPKFQLPPEEEDEKKDDDAQDQESAPQAKRKQRRVPTGHISKIQLPPEEEEDEDNDDEAEARVVPGASSDALQYTMSGPLGKTEQMMDSIASESQGDLRGKDVEEAAPASASPTEKRLTIDKDYFHKHFTPCSDGFLKSFHEKQFPRRARQARQDAARDVLAQSTIDGSLPALLASLSADAVLQRPSLVAAMPPAEAEDPSPIESQSKEALANAVMDGSLVTALASEAEYGATPTHAVPPADAVADAKRSKERVKQKARGSLLRASLDGSLSSALASTRGPTSDDATKKGISANKDDAPKARLREMLSKSADDGSLQAAIASHAVFCEAKASEADSTVAVQAQARAALIEATRSGSIAQVMAEHRKEDSSPTDSKARSIEAQAEAKDALSKAVVDGSLAPVLASEAHQAEAKDALSKAVVDGSLAPALASEAHQAEAKEALSKAVVEGSLAPALASEAHQAEAKEALSKAVVDGSLAPALASEVSSGSKEPLADQEAPRRQSHVRQKARADLLKAARGNKLGEAISHGKNVSKEQVSAAEAESKAESKAEAMPKVAPNKEDLRKRARSQLVQANRDGRLAESLKVHHTNG